MTARYLLAAALVAGWAAPSAAGPFLPDFRGNDLEEVQARLRGRVLDYTDNHGPDRRIHAPSLGDRRDVYVYLPPGYDPARRYPLAVLLHGFTQDEGSVVNFLTFFDNAICAGTLAPCVVAIPDGSINGRPALSNSGSFFINSKAGRFEDFLARDLWCFLHGTFALRPEREAHALAGASMGGFGAYNHGFKYRDRWGVLGGVMPPLNIRYGNRRGNPQAEYDPADVAYRETFHPWTPVARVFGVIPIRQRRITQPLFGLGYRNVAKEFAAGNPIEMLGRLNVRPGEFRLYVGFGGRDEFNIHSQCEHFLDECRRRGLGVAVARIPDGPHSMQTASELMPSFIRFLGGAFEPFRQP